MSISKACMLVNLHIKQWSGLRKDKIATAKAEQAQGAKQGSMRTSKYLVPKSHLDPIFKASGAVRNHFYAKTLPWKDNGDRICTKGMYLPFVEEHSELVAEFNKARDTYLDTQYDTDVAQAQFVLGASFDPGAYPSKEELRRKFSIDFSVEGIAEASDFRVDMSSAHTVRLQQQIEQNLQERANQAMATLWEQTREKIEHFRDRMEPDAVFKEATIQGVQDLIDTLPLLNFTDDPKLNELADVMKAELSNLDSKTLRTNPVVREAAAKAADDVLGHMAGLMKAFGAAA